MSMPLPKRPDTSGRESTREKGNSGEDQAAAYLLDKGYRIVCRQYRSRGGEIDCVAYDPEGTLVFLEVKSSRGTSCGNPLFWITPAKQKTLFRMARQYLIEHGITSTPCRFDVIALVRGKIDHIRNAIVGR